MTKIYNVSITNKNIDVSSFTKLQDWIENELYNVELYIDIGIIGFDCNGGGSDYLSIDFTITDKYINKIKNIKEFEILDISESLYSYEIYNKAKEINSKIDKSIKNRNDMLSKIRKKRK